MMARTLEPRDIHRLVILTAYFRKEKFPSIMRDQRVIRLLESELLHLVGRPVAKHSVCSEMEKVFARAERQPIWTLHRAYLLEGTP